MRFYFAGAFPYRDQYLEIVHRLEAQGLISTSRWMILEHHITNEKDAEVYGPAFSGHDHDDVQEADILILHTTDVDDPYKSGGRHVEFGMALAWQKPIIVYDPYAGNRPPGGKSVENIFHFYDRWISFGNTYVPAVSIVKTEAELIEAMNVYHLIIENSKNWPEVDYDPQRLPSTFRGEPIFPGQLVEII